MEIMDLHTHSQFSDGHAKVEELLQVAKSKGYSLGISDHVFCDKMTNMDIINNYLEELKKYDVYRGVEANMKDNILWPDHIANKLDYVISSVHSFIHPKTKERIWLSYYFGHRAGHRDTCPKFYDVEDAQFIMEELYGVIKTCISQSRVDIYGHSTVLPFHDVLQGTSFIDDWENDILSLCAKHNVAIEISGLWKAPTEQFIKKALQRDIQFSLGSDCHKREEICNLDYGLELIETLQIPEHRMFKLK